MANQPAAKIRASVPVVAKAPLGTFIQQLAVPGMSEAQTRHAALMVQSGQAGIPRESK